MTTDLKNLYEDLIQEMIIDGINGMTPEMKEMIQTAPVEKRRSMILTVMEENNVEHRLICNRIQKTMDTVNYSEMEHIKDVVGMLREYVKVSKTEVKTMGEVMTPISLVEEMLDTLPYEVWSNPNLKWLDPCNGVGTFFSVVIERLMKGLISFQPDEKLRYKHIIENMVYACELQAKNLFLYLYAFDPKNEYAMNVYCGSYLDEGFNKHMELWGIEKYNVVIMNPPYQNLKEGNKKSQALWDKFVVKTVSELVEGGYLVAVHPDGWRNVDGMFKDTQTLLKNKQILYLEIHDYSDGLKTFGVKTTYDFYCLHNVPNTMFTKIKGSDNKNVRIDISKMEFIPNGMFDVFEKLRAKNDEEIVNILGDSSYHTQRIEQMSKEQTEDFKYPCIYTSLSTNVVNFWYSNIQTKGHFNTPKVIWTNGTATKPIIDELGEYGLTQFAYAIIDDVDKLPYIQKALLNPEFIRLMNFRDGNGGKFGHRYDRKVIATFRKDFWKEFLK